MKFVENQKADDTLDLVCRMCPLHLLEPGDKMKCHLPLIDLLEDHYYWVRWEAVKALDNLEPDWRKKYEKILRQKSTIIKE